MTPADPSRDQVTWGLLTVPQALESEAGAVGLYERTIDITDTAAMGGFDVLY